MNRHNPQQSLPEEPGFFYDGPFTEEDNRSASLWRDMLTKEGTVEIRASGKSMHPSIRDGSLLLVSSFNENDPPRLGEIALFFRDGQMAAHRVLARRCRAGHLSLTTIGDAHKHATLDVPASCLVGRVIAIQDGSRTSILTGRRARWSACLVAWSLRARRMAHGLLIKLGLGQRES